MAHALRSLVAASFGEAEAAAYEKYVPSVIDSATLEKVGQGLLQHFPVIPGACMLMSAVHACMLEDKVGHRAYVAVGLLYVDGIRVYGDDKPVDPAHFDRSSVSWDGHGWVVLGDIIADNSLIRTARSGNGHRILQPHMDEEFPDTELIIGRASDLAAKRLRYEPRYILKQEQADALFRVHAP